MKQIKCALPCSATHISCRPAKRKVRTPGRPTCAEYLINQSLNGIVVATGSGQKQFLAPLIQIQEAIQRPGQIIIPEIKFAQCTYRRYYRTRRPCSGDGMFSADMEVRDVGAIPSFHAPVFGCVV
jgi:hypothetical protein